MWVVTCHQYGISALVSQTSFRRETVVASRNVSCFLRLKELSNESIELPKMIIIIIIIIIIVPYISQFQYACSIALHRSSKEIHNYMQY